MGKDWHPRDIESSIKAIIGETQGPGAGPSERMDAFDAEEVQKVIWEKLHLENVALSNYGRVVAAVLRGAVEASGSPEVKAAGELLGFELVTREEIEGSLARKWPAGVPKEPWRRETKTARYYTALVAEGRAGTAVKTAWNSQARWVSAMAKALLEYLDRHRDRALEVVASLNPVDGFLKSEEPVISFAAKSGESFEEPSGFIETPPGYVHRREIEQRFNEHVRDGIKIIALVGLAGMGKTTLAESLSVGSPFLEVQQGQLPLIDLRPVLAEYGIDASNTTPDNAWDKLAELLTVKSGPRFVVLDNLQSIDELQGRLPRKPEAIIVITCREWGNTAPARYCRLHVDAMRDAEAVELFMKLIPSIGEGEAKSFARTLDNYPLLIQAVCGVAERTLAGVREVCHAFDTKPGNAVTDKGEKLRAILIRSLTVVEERGGFALMLLGLVSVVAAAKTEREFLQPVRLNLEDLGVLSAQIMRDSHFCLDEALRLLLDLSLISVSDDSESRQRRGLVHMHPQIASILVSLPPVVASGWCNAAMMLMLIHGRLRDSLMQRVNSLDFDQDFKSDVARLRSIQTIEWAVGLSDRVSNALDEVRRATLKKIAPDESPVPVDLANSSSEPPLSAEEMAEFEALMTDIAEHPEAHLGDHYSEFMRTIQEIEAGFEAYEYLVDQTRLFFAAFPKATS